MWFVLFVLFVSFVVRAFRAFRGSWYVVRGFRAFRAFRGSCFSCFSWFVVRAFRIESAMPFTQKGHHFIPEKSMVDIPPFVGNKVFSKDEDGEGPVDDFGTPGHEHTSLEIVDEDI